MATRPTFPHEAPEDRVQRSFGAPARHQMYVWNNRHLDTRGGNQAEQRSLLFPNAEQQITVLVVDDERSIALLLEELLVSAGYRVLVAHSGRAALAMARAERPALILTDCMMPGIDGAEFIRRLRMSPVTYDIPVVMMSSIRPRRASHDGIIGLRTPEERILRTIKRGVYPAAVGDACLPFLEKPFDLDVVLDVVETATAAAANGS